MDFLSAMRMSGDALRAQRTRVNVATSNLANAESTRGPDGKPYRRKDVVLEAVPFEDTLEATAEPLRGVAVSEIAEDQSDGKRVFHPEHPDADQDGFVTLPNVNPVHETVNLMSAARSYDANASALETLKTMAMRALDIMR